jgi:hypothetical protein
MQISEIASIEKPADGWPKLTEVSDDVLIAWILRATARLTWASHLQRGSQGGLPKQWWTTAHNLAGLGEELVRRGVKIPEVPDPVEQVAGG